MAVQLRCCACGIPHRPRPLNYVVSKHQKLHGLTSLRIITCDLGSLFVHETPCCVLFRRSFAIPFTLAKDRELEHWLLNLLFSFSFISADKAVGQQGFRATWTEVSTNTDCQDQFLCGKSKYCIAELLRCDKVYNCGPTDTSDEDNCKFRNR